MERSNGCWVDPRLKVEAIAVQDVGAELEQVRSDAGKVVGLEEQAQARLLRLHHQWTPVPPHAFHPLGVKGRHHLLRRLVAAAPTHTRERTHRNKHQLTSERERSVTFISP